MDSLRFLLGLVLLLAGAAAGLSLPLLVGVWLYRRLNALRQLTQIAAKLDAIAALLERSLPLAASPHAPAAQPAAPPAAPVPPPDKVQAVGVRQEGDRFAATCPHCQRTLRLRAGHLGRRLSCPNCGEALLPRSTRPTATPPDDAFASAVGLD